MAPRVEAFHSSMSQLFSELVDGPPPGDAYMLNPGDAGLLRSLDRISAAAASRPASAGGASIAAHVDHICYGLELLNRWSDGDPNPWATADWAASWTHGTVDDKAWDALRSRLADAARRWQQALKQPRDLSDVELNGVIGSTAHLAYHLGAIRQIDASAQGPKAT
jgi:hypothetical protein